MEHDSFLPLKDRPPSSSSNIMIPLNKIVPFDPSQDFPDSSLKTPDITARRFFNLEKVRKDEEGGRGTRERMEGGGEGEERAGGVADNERKKEDEEKKEDLEGRIDAKGTSHEERPTIRFSSGTVGRKSVGGRRESQGRKSVGTKEEGDSSPSKRKKRMSIANFGKFTKNAVSELSSTVKQNDFKNEYRKGLELAYNFLEINGSKNPFLNLIKNFLFYNIQLIIFLMNLLSIVSLILVADYRIGDLNVIYRDPLRILELILAGFFGIENFLDIFFSYKASLSFYSIIKTIKSFGFLVNALLIVEIVVTFGYSTEFLRPHPIFVLLTFLRSLKLIKLRRIFEFNMRELKKLLLQNKLNYSINEEDDLNSVIDCVVDIVVSIFIEATSLVCLNELLDYNGFSNGRHFAYVTACYYTIVSLTSIGYGDISPLRWESRLFVIFNLLINLTILSTFIGNITEKIKKISPFVKNYNFKNHVVIIGDLPFSFLQFFIKELRENDLVHRELEKSAKNKNNIIKYIIVGKNDPSKELERWMILYSMQEKETEVEYLKANITDVIWYKQSNLQSAKHIFVFSINLGDTELEAFENDKKISFNIQNIINTYPRLPITLILSTSYEENINKDSLWKNVVTVPFRLMNDYIMANSIENQGFNTWLVHLLTLREKNIPDFKKDKNFDRLKEYAEDMTQEIYPIKLSSLFVGKTFTEAARIIYFSSIDFMDYYLLTSEGEEPENAQNVLTNKTNLGLQLIAITTTSDEPNENNRILINPINYYISEKDVAYVVAEHQKAAQIISNLNASSPMYETYIKNMNLFARVLDQKPERSGELVARLFSTIDQLYDNWRINPQKYFENLKAKIIQDPSLKNKLPASPPPPSSVAASGPGNAPSPSTLSPPTSSVSNIPDFFNLYLDDSPKGLFRNHLIIKGNLVSLANIANVIRFYSKRPIVFFTDSLKTLGDWTKIKDRFANIYCVVGSVFLIKHIDQMDPKKAYKILILSNPSKNEGILDSDNIVFTRILADFFEIPKFLVELLDEDNIKYLSSQPKITLDDQLDYFFWPYFVRGNIHFSSLIMSFVARSLYNSNWISFLKQLIQPNEGRKEVRNADKGEAKEEEIIENGRIYTLLISEEVREEVKVYGQLQYFLMNNDPPVMAIALLKTKDLGLGYKKASTINNKMFKSLLTQHISRTIDDIYGEIFVLTNPSFLTKLDVGDKVLVMGNNSFGSEVKVRRSPIIRKTLPRIRNYLTKDSLDLKIGNHVKDDKYRILKHFREKQRVWKDLDKRKAFKEQLGAMIESTSKTLSDSIRFYEDFCQDI